MGIVFHARDVRLGRDAALKCPWPHLASDPVSRHRFLRESKAASRITHPTIVPVFEVFEERDLPWIAMEWVDGATLTDVLSGGEPLPVDEIIVHAEDLTDALRAAHAKGVLHRDIKPGNVLIGKDGRARLTDFGLARFFSAEGEASQQSTNSSQLTKEGKIVGTIAYMSPEQLLGAEPDPRTDIFALGVILYEMCTAKAAFSPTPQWDVYQAVQRKEPVAIGRLNYAVPRALERIIRKAIARRPEERYQDARDMLADVRALKRRRASGDFDPEEEFGSRRRASWTVILASSGALALAVAAWIAWHRGDPAPVVLGTPRQITSAPGTEHDPAISPDGTLIAYASDEGGGSHIWLIDAHGGNPLRLTGDPAADRRPTWFPDGSALAFVSDRGGRDAVWKVPALGGSPTLVVPDADGPAVSPDGRRIAFMRTPANGDPRIYLAPVAAPEAASPLTKDGVGQWGQFDPAWSPDATRIVFADSAHIWIADPTAHTARQLTDGVVADTRPAFSSDGTHVYFGSMRDGTLALWRVSANGGSPERLTYGTGPETTPTIDRAGRRMAFTSFNSDADVGLRNMITGSQVRLSSPAYETAPAIAPDGTRVYFCSGRWGGVMGLAAQSIADGKPTGPVERLTEWNAALPRVSPDGRWLAFWRIVDGQRDIWLMSSRGGEAIRFTDDPAADIQPAWSPDGAKLAFVSERGGTPHIWVEAVAEGRAIGTASRVTSGPDFDSSPEWSPDGRSISFVRKIDGIGEIFVVQIDGRALRRVTHGADAQRLRWLAPPSGLFASGVWGGSTFDVRRVDLGTGRAAALSPPLTGTDPSSALFDLDRNGRMLVSMISETRGDVWILEAPPGTF